MARIRELKCELGLLERADGSARLCQGDTSVLCSVYGPVEVKMIKEMCERATIEVLVKPVSGNSGPNERYLEQLIKSTCETIIKTALHPHTAISITLQIENDAGSLLSVLLNTCCLALIDASIPLTSVFSAITSGITKEGDLLVDPDLQQEEEACQSIFTFVIEGDSGDILTSHASGEFNLDQLKLSIRMAKECSGNFVSFYKDTVNRKLSKDAKYANLYN